MHFGNFRSCLQLTLVLFVVALRTVADSTATPTGHSPEGESPVGGPPPNICPLYQIVVDEIGGTADSFTEQDVFVSNSTYPACIEDELQKAFALCHAWVNAKNSTSSGWEVYFDDCVVRGYLTKNGPMSELGGLLTEFTSWEPSIVYCSTPRGGRPSECYIEEFLLDANCNSIPNPTSAQIDAKCSGLAHYYTSPISLIWVPGYDIDAEAMLNQFPLDPQRPGIWYNWKASGKAPLLVYDPEHSGKITSATQLFGNWTFGGKRLVRLESGTISDHGTAAGAEWANGYEALATLDADGDRRVSGDELKALALWFDDNRDGVSNAGEVKTLNEAGVTALFYQPDPDDGTRGRDIYASVGFERIVAGKTIVGASVDWFAEGERSQYALLSKLLSQGQAAEPAKALLPRNLEPSQQQPAPSSTDGKASLNVNLGGSWRWTLVGEKVMGSKTRPGGYLLFKDPGDTNKFTGHSIGEVQFAQPSSGATRTVKVSELKGEKSVTGDGLVQVSFEIIRKEITVITSTALLSADGMSLNGKSKAVVTNGKKQRTIEYSWIAERTKLSN